MSMVQRLKKTRAFIALMASVVCALALSGCSSTSDPNVAEGGFRFPSDGSAPQAPRPAMQSTVLRVNDMITVSFSDVPSPGLTEIRARIPASGMLTLHYNVQVKAVDKTIPELEHEIRESYVPRLYKNLTAIVRSEERFFFVGGEVKTPNRYPLQADLTVLRAIDAAGSFTDFANRKKIELRRENGQRFFINERKAKENPALDLPVLANDHIIVKRSIW